jgi:hypothetical protein
MGLQVVPASSKPPVLPDALLIRNIQALSATSTAQTLELQGEVSGSVDGSGAQPVSYPFRDDQVVLLTEKAIRLELHAGQGRRITIQSGFFPASSVRIANQEQLPTNLDRNKALVTSLFLGGVGLFLGLRQLAELLRKKGSK